MDQGGVTLLRELMLEHMSGIILRLNYFDEEKHERCT